FMTGTFKPDGTGFGPSGTLDLLVEDGRGGSAIGNLPIVVVPPGLPSSGAQVPGAPSPVVQAPVVQAPVAQAPVTPSPTAQAPLPSGPGPGAAKPAAATAAPASPMPSLPALSSLAEARTLALGVPCALIDIQEAPSPGQSGRLLVAGPALPGAAFDSFMRRIETPGRDADVDTEPLDPGHCAALAVMTDLVRHSRERDALRVVAPSVPVPVGGQLVISAEAIPGGALYLDLYAADGSVQHLHRGPVPGTRAEVAVTAAAPGPPGQRLLVAIATAAPLALPQRPANENEAAYLPALQHELARLGAAAVELRAEVATLSIIAASRPIAVPSRPPVSSAASRPPVQGNPRCQDIVARVTLGGNPVGRRSRHPSDQLWALMDSFVAGQSDVRYGRQPPASGHAASPGVGAGAQAGMRRHRHSGDRADSHGMRGSPQSG
ncbi:MAG: hypothetical protein ACJ8AW_37910, partial [Rhodopila sp.]